jgi:DNA/RNA endonuclease G (NUC1)
MNKNLYLLISWKKFKNNMRNLLKKKTNSTDQKTTLHSGVMILQKRKKKLKDKTHFKQDHRLKQKVVNQKKNWKGAAI